MKSGSLTLYNILLHTVKGSTGLPVHCGLIQYTGDTPLRTPLQVQYCRYLTVALGRDHC